MVVDKKGETAASNTVSMVHVIEYVLSMPPDAMMNREVGRPQRQNQEFDFIAAGNHGNWYMLHLLRWDLRWMQFTRMRLVGSKPQTSRPAAAYTVRSLCKAVEGSSTHLAEIKASQEAAFLFLMILHLPCCDPIQLSERSKAARTLLPHPELRAGRRGQSIGRHVAASEF